jgi:DNA-nicking Smr family endonuclease
MTSGSGGSRRSDAPDEDRRLFEREMRDVRRLPTGPTRVVITPPPQAAPRPWPAPPAPQADAAAAEAFVPGLPPDRRRALRRGEPGPEATLDLHGATAPEAARRLKSFVAAARAAGHRCVCVVPGRGLHSGADGPVLRGTVGRTLGAALGNSVLGFAPAPARHGGEGALLVLLRRSR